MTQAFLESAKAKIREHAENHWKGGAFNLALSPGEVDALNLAYPKGFELTGSLVRITTKDEHGKFTKRTIWRPKP